MVLCWTVARVRYDGFAVGKAASRFGASPGRWPRSGGSWGGAFLRGGWLQMDWPECVVSIATMAFFGFVIWCLAKYGS
jgi:hypothetical protein